METDLELLERWRAGDRAAGGRLIDRHFLDIRTYFRLRMPIDYEDLLQETFTRVSKALATFRCECSFRTFLFRIARNVLAETLRKRYQTEIDPLTSSLADLTGETQSTIMIEREHLRMLLDSLRSLPLAEQDLLELYFFQRIPARELAGIFELSEGGIRSRIRHHLDDLRRRYLDLSRRPHEHEIDENLLGRWMLELREHVRR